VPAPAHLDKHAQKINRWIEQEVGATPTFAWVWGADMVVKMPSHEATGEARYEPREVQTASGLTIITHEPLEIDFLVVGREFHQSFVFCFEDRSPIARVRWNPWCPSNAYTRDGTHQVHLLHTAPNQAPTLDYTQEILTQVKLGLAERSMSREHLKRQALSRAEEEEAQRERASMQRIGMRMAEVLPVGLFRKPGDKSHVSFPISKGTP
jgi:hypothetical protein